MSNGNIAPGGKPPKKKSVFQKLGKDAKNIGNSIGKAFNKKSAARKAAKKLGGMKPVKMKGFGSGS